MKCLRMQVGNFRNIEKADLEFSGGIDILSGENAQGKTNMLEAIFYTALGRSFRPAKDRELIKFGCEYATLTNTFSDSIRNQNIDMCIFSDRRQRKVELNRVKVQKMSEMVGTFRVVLFSPEHLSLIKEGPAVRRQYLDVAISQLYPAYLQALQRSGQILKERNQLLKDAEESEDRRNFDQTIDVWSYQYAKECAVISKYRYEYINRAVNVCRDIFSDMTGEKEVPELTYESTLGEGFQDHGDIGKMTEEYFRLLSCRHDREIGAGATLWGIHRDDVGISLNGKAARIYASQGQQRSLALAMKLAEGEISYSEYGKEYPVFLFDDVLSELDLIRRAYLMDKVKDKQVIMTTCEPEATFENAKNVNFTYVRNGIYTKAEKN